MGLDRPLYVQFFDYVGGVLQGDLGISVITHRPVMDEFLEPVSRRRSNSAFFALIFSTLVGLPAGVLAAVKRGSVFDHVRHGHQPHRLFDADLLVGPAADPVLLASISAGRRSPAACRDDFFVDEVTGFMLIDTLLSDDESRARSLSALHHLILPTIVLGTVPLAVIARMTRSAMLEVLGEDYIRTARAKGLGDLSHRRHPCAAQRADPGRDRDRPAGRHPDGRRDPDRERVLLARHRQVAGRVRSAGATIRRCKAACW